LNQSNTIMGNLSQERLLKQLYRMLKNGNMLNMKWHCSWYTLLWQYYQ